MTLHYLQRSSILHSAKFLSLCAVGGSYLWGFLGLPLVANYKETCGFLHSWKQHHSFCGVTGCFEANNTTFHLLGSHSDVSEKPRGKSQLDYNGDTDQLHLPPMALRNSLLRRLKRFCSDHSGVILLSLFSWEQMPQEGMKLSAAKTGITVSQSTCN